MPHSSVYKLLIGSIVAIAAWAAMPSARAADIGLIQRMQKSGASVASAEIFFPSANVKGDVIVVAAGVNGAGSASVSDSQGNIYKTALTQLAQLGGAEVYIWYACNCKAGFNTVKVTAPSGNSDLDVSIFEYSGLAASPPDFAVAQANGGDTRRLSSPAGTATAAPELLLGFGYSPNGNFPLSPDIEFSLIASTHNSRGGESSATEAKTVASAGSYEATERMTRQSPWIMALVGFKAGNGAGPPSP